MACKKLSTSTLSRANEEPDTEENGAFPYCPPTKESISLMIGILLSYDRHSFGKTLEELQIATSLSSLRRCSDGT